MENKSLPEFNGSPLTKRVVSSTHVRYANDHHVFKIRIVDCDTSKGQSFTRKRIERLFRLGLYALSYFPSGTRREKHHHFNVDRRDDVASSMLMTLCPLNYFCPWIHSRSWWMTCMVKTSIHYVNRPM